MRQSLYFAAMLAAAMPTFADNQKRPPIIDMHMHGRTSISLDENVSLGLGGACRNRVR